MLGWLRETAAWAISGWVVVYGDGDPQRQTPEVQETDFAAPQGPSNPEQASEAIMRIMAFAVQAQPQRCYQFLGKSVQEPEMTRQFVQMVEKKKIGNHNYLVQ